MTRAATTSARSKPTAFLEGQRSAIEAERAACARQISALDAELASLSERDGVPQVDFTEEGGEGGTMAIERDRDKALRDTLLARLLQLDEARSRLDAGTYGICESCGGPIVEARLEALPDATECMACKGGGLLRRAGGR